MKRKTPKPVRPPAWLIDRVEYWRQVLGLSGWTITTGVRKHLQPPGRVAECQTVSRLNLADLYFRSDRVTPGFDLDVDIVHELLHVIDSRRLAFVHHRLIRRLPEPLRDISAEIYDDLVEPVIEQCARIICNAHRADRKPGDRLSNPAKRNRRQGR